MEKEHEDITTDIGNDLERVCYLLRSLEPVHPQDGLGGGLTDRVMERLPAKRRSWDRAACTLRLAVSTKAHYGERHTILPSDPVEVGFLFLFTGVFLLVVSLIVLFKLYMELSHGALTLSPIPSCLAAIVLVKHGWIQLASPRRIIGFRSALFGSSCLFASTALAGAALPGGHPLELVALWLGLSGLITAVVLDVILKQALDKTPTVTLENMGVGGSSAT